MADVLPSDALLDHAYRCWLAEEVNAQRLTTRANILLAAMGALLGLGVFRIEWTRPTDSVAVVTEPWGTVVKGILIAGSAFLFFAFVQIIRKRSLLAEMKPFYPWLLPSVLALTGLACLVWGWRVGANAMAPIAVPSIVLCMIAVVILASTTPWARTQDAGQPRLFASAKLHLPIDTDKLFELIVDEATARIAVLASIVEAAADLHDRNCRFSSELRRVEIVLLSGVLLVLVAMVVYMYGANVP